MTDNERKFFEEYRQLVEKYGCCNSPFIWEAKEDEREEQVREHIEHLTYET